MNRSRQRATSYKHSFSKKALCINSDNETRTSLYSTDFKKRKQLEAIIFNSSESTRNPIKQIYSNSSYKENIAKKMKKTFDKERSLLIHSNKKIPGMIMANKRNNVPNSYIINSEDKNTMKTNSLKMNLKPKVDLKIDYEKLMNILQKHIKICPKLKIELCKAVIS